MEMGKMKAQMELGSILKNISLLKMEWLLEWERLLLNVNLYNKKNQKFYLIYIIYMIIKKKYKIINWGNLKFYRYK